DGYKQLDGFSGEPPRGATTEQVYVTPGYFETMGIPVLAGRAFRESDSTDSAPVALVSQSFAIRTFHGVREALGRHVALRRTSFEIVGVVGDVQQHSGLNGDAGPISVDPTLYRAAAQTGPGFFNAVHVWFSPKWVVRTDAAPSRIEPTIQTAVAAVDPQLPV